MSNASERHINWRFAALTALVLALMAWGCLKILDLNADIIAMLPSGGRVLSDARDVMAHHPMQDQIMVEITLGDAPTERLLEAGRLAAERLAAADLFRDTGMAEIRDRIPELMRHVTANLPILFTEQELAETVAPLLASEKVRTTLTTHLSRLHTMEGIGQGADLPRDPLGLRFLVLSRMRHLAPSENVRFQDGQLLSGDGRHLLLATRPAGSGTDTRFARQATAFFDALAAELKTTFGEQTVLTHFGAYRAALDNETTAKTDVRRAVWLATLGISLLLVVSFPRPWLGLLALVPALAGTVCALFYFAVVRGKISLMTLGFGAALISITVDHGIAYFLFLDRHRETRGKDAAEEVRAVGLLSALTTVAAFLTLKLSGFPLLSEVGEFAAVGIAASFMFVHTVFPRIFITMPAAKRMKRLRLQGFVDAFALSGGRFKAWAALGLVASLVGFSVPRFHVDLRSMNTIGPETRQAETRLRKVWGDVFSKIFLMVEADSPAGLQETGDTVLRAFEEARGRGELADGFLGSMIFPGNDRAAANGAAWHRFWQDGRREQLKRSLEACADLGFTADAFAPFLAMTADRRTESPPIPERLFPLVGITQDADGGKWRQFSTLKPGPAYEAAQLYRSVSGPGFAGVRLFDPVYFSVALGKALMHTFLKMAGIVGVSVAVLLLILFRSVKLTVAALLPIGFALIASLGTLRLLGRPLDIPALMLAIVVIGMGIDYAIFMTRSYQRYPDPRHPSAGLVRMTIFLAAASTLMGFGSLSMAHHAMLRSAGLPSFIGIGYALLGTFAILPPILGRLCRTGNEDSATASGNADKESAGKSPNES